MAGYEFNENAVYTADEKFTITGEVLNSICQQILRLQKEIKNLKDAETQKELEDLRIRDKNPAVKDAWDQYQTVLGLSRNK